VGALGGGLALLGHIGRQAVPRPGDGTISGAGRLTLAPGQYFYLKVESSRSIDGYVRHEETWWAADGSGESRRASTRPDKYPFPPSGVYKPGKFPTEVDAADLSTNPDLLKGQLRDRARAAGFTAETEGIWNVTGGLLLDVPNAAPDLRAALFDVARTLDGVKVHTGDRDPAGRSATVVELTVPDAVQRMYFDEINHQLMTWMSAYEQNVPSWVIFDSGIVDSAGTRPEGSQWLFPPAEGTGVPDDAAVRFYHAWVQGDRAAAQEVGTQRAVDIMFGVDPHAPSSYTDDRLTGCVWKPSEAQYRCDFYTPQNGFDLDLYVQRKGSRYLVTHLFFAGTD
jgi:hypothetical protein